MFKNLKVQLFISGLAAIALLLLGVWAATSGHAAWAIIVMVAVCIYVILLNLWFWRYVSDPISELTDFARHIAAGSYGGRLPMRISLYQFLRVDMLSLFFLSMAHNHLEHAADLLQKLLTARRCRCQNNHESASINNGGTRIPPTQCPKCS